jgi:hypothetical protein
LKKAKSMENIHPNAPRRLVNLWLKLGSDRQVAKERDINQYYVSQLLWRGIEPNKKELRKKLFLPIKPLNPRVPKPEEFPGQRRIIRIIRRLHRETTLSFKRWRSNNDKEST